MRRSLCFRTIVGESGCPRVTDLLISRTAGLSPEMPYVAKCISSRGTKRVTSGFQSIRVSCTCWRDVWSSRSPGQNWDAAKVPSLYSLAVSQAESGLDSGSSGGVSYFKDGQFRASYTAADGLGEGRVPDLQLDPDGALWAATQDGGLSRIKDGRIATLTSRNGLPCDAIHWTIEDDDRSFWLYTACGLVRITRSRTGRVDRRPEA